MEEIFANVMVTQKAGGSHLDEGLKAAGYSGVNDERLNGLDASVQVIQLGERGSALYNVCAPRPCLFSVVIDHRIVRRHQVQLHRPAPLRRSMQERYRCQRRRGRQRQQQQHG